MIWIVRTVSQEVFKNDLHKHSVMGYMLGPMERYQDENGPALPPKSRDYKSYGDTVRP